MGINKPKIISNYYFVSIVKFRKEVARKMLRKI